MLKDEITGLTTSHTYTSKEVEDLKVLLRELKKNISMVEKDDEKMESFIRDCHNDIQQSSKKSCYITPYLSEDVEDMKHEVYIERMFKVDNSNLQLE